MTLRSSPTQSVEKRGAVRGGRSEGEGEKHGLRAKDREIGRAEEMGETVHDDRLD